MIKILISGTAGSGKSAVAELVRKTLAAEGIKVELCDDNGYGVVEERPGVIAASLHDRLGAISKKGQSVRVQTKVLGLLEMKKEEQREKLATLTAMGQANGEYE